MINKIYTLIELNKDCVSRVVYHTIVCIRMVMTSSCYLLATKFTSGCSLGKV